MDTCFGLSHLTRNQVAPRRASHPCRRHRPLRGKEGSSRSRARPCPRPRCFGGYFHPPSGRQPAPGRRWSSGAALPDLSPPRCAQGFSHRRLESCRGYWSVGRGGKPPWNCQLRAKFCDQSRVPEILAQYDSSSTSAIAQPRACRKSARDRAGKQALALEARTAYPSRLGAARRHCTSCRSD